MKHKTCAVGVSIMIMTGILAGVRNVPCCIVSQTIRPLCGITIENTVNATVVYRHIPSCSCHDYKTSYDNVL